MTTFLEQSVFHLKWVHLKEKKKRIVSRAALVEIQLKVKVILNVYLYFIAYFFTYFQILLAIKLSFKNNISGISFPIIPSDQYFHQTFGNSAPPKFSGKHKSPFWFVSYITYKLI